MDTATTPMLLKAVSSGAIQPGKLITHRFRLTETPKAYETFANAAREKALKVVMVAE